VQISYADKLPTTMTTTMTKALGHMKSVLRSLIGQLTTDLVDERFSG
jgi:hypothetical protein